MGNLFFDEPGVKSDRILLTVHDIGLKFRTRSGWIVTLHDNGLVQNTEELWPLYHSGFERATFHGVNVNGKSCIGNRDADIVGRC